MKAFITLILCLAVFAVTRVYGQNTVVIGTMVDKPNALLVLNPPGANQGFLLPQISTSSRLSITPSPGEDGLIVFDNTEKEFYHWKNNQWVKGLGTSSQSLTFNDQTLKLSISNGNEVNLSALKEIPSQAANAGKFITTDGTTLSWATVGNIGDITSIVAGKGLTGGGLSGDASLEVKVDNSSISFNALDQLQLPNTTVTAGTYGTSTSVSQFTVDAKGRITSAVNVPIPSVTPTLQYYNLDPSDFRSTRGSDRDHDNGLIFNDNTTFITVYKKDESDILIAPLHLPDGAIIQQILLYYVDRDARNLTLNVYRKAFTGGNTAVITSWTSSGASGSIQSSTHTPLTGQTVIDNSLYTYRLTVQLDITDDSNDSGDSDLRVYAVQVKYIK